jgi:hypothetical protein
MSRARLQLIRTDPVKPEVADPLLRRDSLNSQAFIQPIGKDHVSHDYKRGRL